MRYYQKEHATLGDGQMVTGESGDRVGVGWPGGCGGGDGLLFMVWYHAH